MGIKINKDAVCDAIYSSKSALSYGKVILTSGKISVFYIDHRAILANPKNTRIISDELTKVANYFGDGKNYSITSSEAAGIPWGSIVAHNLGVGFSVVRKNGKLMGTIPKYIEEVVAVDDLNTTLGTVLKVIETVKSEGANIHNYIVSIDREEPTPENEKKFKESGVTLTALVTGMELIDYGFKEGLISEEQAELVRKYRRNPDDFAIEIIKENLEWIESHERLNKTKEYYARKPRVRKVLEDAIGRYWTELARRSL